MPAIETSCGLQAVAEDARALIAAAPAMRPAAQRRVDMDVAVGDHLGAGVDRREHDQVAAAA